MKKPLRSAVVTVASAGVTKDVSLVLEQIRNPVSMPFVLRTYVVADENISSDDDNPIVGYVFCRQDKKTTLHWNFVTSPAGFSADLGKTFSTQKDALTDLVQQRTS